MAQRLLRPRGDGYQPPELPNNPDSASDNESDDDRNNGPENGQQPPPIQAPPPLQYYAREPNMIARQAAPVQYIKNLATFQNGSDLLIFLHRFNSYCRALRVPEIMMASLLIAHLDDTSLRGISRHLNDNLAYEEVVELLKKSQGYAANNTDKHVTDMAARKRLKTEKVMDYFIDLSRMSELAYPNPNQRQIRDANLRQEFIKNINHPMIAARLREHPQMPMEELLDLAVLLENCYDASKISSQQVNFVGESTEDAVNAKITNLTNMVEKLVVNQIEQENTDPMTLDQTYRYQGDLAPRGLRDPQGNNQNPFRSRSPRPFRNNYFGPPRYRNFQHQYNRQPDQRYYPNRNGRSYSPQNRNNAGYRNNTDYRQRGSSWNSGQRQNNYPSYNRTQYRGTNNRQTFENRGNNNNNRNNSNNSNNNNYDNNYNFNRNRNSNDNFPPRRQNINHIQNFRRTNQPRQIT